MQGWDMIASLLVPGVPPSSLPTHAYDAMDTVGKQRDSQGQSDEKGDVSRQRTISRH